MCQIFVCIPRPCDEQQRNKAAEKKDNALNRVASNARPQSKAIQDKQCAAELAAELYAARKALKNEALLAEQICTRLNKIASGVSGLLGCVR